MAANHGALWQRTWRHQRGVSSGGISIWHGWRWRRAPRAYQKRHNGRMALSKASAASRERMAAAMVSASAQSGRRWRGAQSINAMAAASILAKKRRRGNQQAAMA